MSYSGDGKDETGRRRSTEEYRDALRAEYARLATADVEGEPASVGGWKRAHTNDAAAGAVGAATGDLLFGASRPTGGMTEEEKFTFDCAGFLVRPSILSAEQIAAVREQVYLIKHDPQQLPPHERKVPGGASSLLIDHPKVVEVLGELLGGPDLIRLEHTQAFWRTRGDREGNAGKDGLAQGWHGGGPGSYTSPVFGYHYKNGSMHAGMVRVIYELGEVSQTDGGTHFIVGSHKANFTMNPAFLRRSEEAILELGQRHSPLIAGYDCPPGSAIFFSEATCHVGPPWQADHPRVSVLHAYAHLATNFRRQRSRFDRVTLAGLPLTKLAYFRPPWTSEPHSLQRFLEKPDMSWGYAGVGDTDGEEENGGGVAAQLLSLESMHQRGFLDGRQLEAAKDKVLLGPPPATPKL